MSTLTARHLAAIEPRGAHGIAGCDPERDKPMLARRSVSVKHRVRAPRLPAIAGLRDAHVIGVPTVAASLQPVNEQAARRRHDDRGKVRPVYEEVTTLDDRGWRRPALAVQPRIAHGVCGVARALDPRHVNGAGTVGRKKRLAASESRGRRESGEGCRWRAIACGASGQEEQSTEVKTYSHGHNLQRGRRTVQHGHALEVYRRAQAFADVTTTTLGAGWQAALGSDNLCPSEETLPHASSCGDLGGRDRGTCDDTEGVHARELSGARAAHARIARTRHRPGPPARRPGPRSTPVTVPLPPRLLRGCR